MNKRNKDIDAICFVKRELGFVTKNKEIEMKVEKKSKVLIVRNFGGEDRSDV